MCTMQFRYYEEAPRRINGKWWVPRSEKYTKIRYRRIYEFAADRWLRSETVERAKFWKSVMDWSAVESVRWRQPTLREFEADNKYS